MFEADSLRQALATLGVLLRSRGHAFEIVVVGGGGLLLLGVIKRPTKDLDALALVEGGAYQIARPLPVPLREAIEDTALALGLDHNWLNPGPTDQLRFGLPEGFRERTTRHEFDALTIQLAGRFDQICLKMYAAANDAPDGKHARDLIELDPSDEDLDAASAWVKQQDTGPEFGRFVDAVVAYVKVRRAH
jgi:hypothetical protein